MNCRAHGGDGNWVPLERALNGGYTQVDCTAAAYLDEEEFNKIPDMPSSPLQSQGQEVMFVSYSKGKIKSMPAFDIIKKLPSFVCLNQGVSIGSDVTYTVDLITSPGGVLLMNPDKDALQKDIDLIRYLEEINALFNYETKVESLARPTAATFGLGSLPPSGKTGSAHRRNISMDMDRPGMLRIMSQDRPELRGKGLMKRFTTVDASKEVVVGKLHSVIFFECVSTFDNFNVAFSLLVVDPYSTGCLITKEIENRGYKIIALWTKGFAPEMKLHVPLAAGKMNYLAEVEEGNDLGETTKSLYQAAGKLRIVACICGGEAGVDTTDLLSERLMVRTNGTQGMFAFRRDKKVQQELIRASGIRAIRQAAGKQWSDVEGFLRKESFPVVLKPTDSAGSDGVKLCHDLEEAKEHFHHLFEVEAVNGGFNTEVLCQEFLRGNEYVVDTVSRDGEHKVMAIYMYDKRPANGSGECSMPLLFSPTCQFRFLRQQVAAFVYFGMVPIESDTPESKMLMRYTKQVLDALGMKNGPGHCEVILTAGGPCLVEMNCRAHGGDGNWRAMARARTGGYSQVEATVDSYLDKKAFYNLPAVPPCPAKAFGQEVMIVSYVEGEVIATPGYDVIKELESFVSLETGISVGSHVEHTIDLVTSVGSASLLHDDPEVLKRDVAVIREMEKNNTLFELKQTSHMMRATSSINLGVEALSLA